MKLIKKEGEFYLFDKETLVASTEETGAYLIHKEQVKGYGNVFDESEWVYETNPSNKDFSYRNKITNNWISQLDYLGFKADKNNGFSKFEMIKCYNDAITNAMRVINGMIDAGTHVRLVSADDYVHLLRNKTEWECEVEMELVASSEKAEKYSLSYAQKEVPKITDGYINILKIK